MLAATEPLWLPAKLCERMLAGVATSGPGDSGISLMGPCLCGPCETTSGQHLHHPRSQHTTREWRTSEAFRGLNGGGAHSNWCTSAGEQNPLPAVVAPPHTMMVLYFCSSSILARSAGSCTFARLGPRCRWEAVAKLCLPRSSGGTFNTLVVVDAKLPMMLVRRGRGALAAPFFTVDALCCHGHVNTCQSRNQCPAPAGTLTKQQRTRVGDNASPSAGWSPLQIRYWWSCGVGANDTMWCPYRAVGKASLATGTMRHLRFFVSSSYSLLSGWSL